MLHISVVLSEHGTPCLVPLELLSPARDLTRALVWVEILRFNLVTLHHWILRLSHLLLLVVVLKPTLVKIHLRLLGLVYGGLALHLLVLQSHRALHRIDLRHVVQKWILNLILLLGARAITNLILLVEISVDILGPVDPSL